MWNIILPFFLLMQHPRMNLLMQIHKILPHFLYVIIAIGSSHTHITTFISPRPQTTFRIDTSRPFAICSFCVCSPFFVGIFVPSSTARTTIKKMAKKYLLRRIYDLLHFLRGDWHWPILQTCITKRARSKKSVFSRVNWWKLNDLSLVRSRSPRPKRAFMDVWALRILFLCVCVVFANFLW
jgi:hypothetical protein